MTASPGTTALALQLRATVGQFVRAVRSQSGTSTTAQSEVLGLLARAGPVSVATLAAVRGVKHQSMRLVVARLAELGLLALRPDPDDGRSQLVALTDQGRASVAADQAARGAYLSGILMTRLSAAERAVLAEAVGLIARLSVVDGEG